MRNPFAAGAFLVISLTILGLIGYAIHQKDLRVDAESALLGTTLELEGAKKALLVSPKEVVKFVTLPPAVEAATKKGLLTPIAAGKIDAKSDSIEVPCPPAEAGTDFAPIEGSQAPPPSVRPSTTHLTFGLTGEFFIGAIHGGVAEYTGTIKGTVWDEGTWHSDVPFNPENVRFDIVVSKDITKAIDAYNEPWFKKHTALLCPGVGVTYNPLDPGRPVNVGITCSYGFVWF